MGENEGLVIVFIVIVVWIILSYIKGNSEDNNNLNLTI